MSRPADHAARIARARLALDGLSVGDAFGERYFGLPATVTVRIEKRELVAPPWRWTDDTAMGLGICDELEAHGAIDRDSLARRFAFRFHEDRMRGYGAGAQQILDAIVLGVAWPAASRIPYPDGSKGNGGAMRAAPLGAYFADDLDRVMTEARASAEVTHAHPEGIAGAVAIALAAAWACDPKGSLFDCVLPRLPDSEVKRRTTEVATHPGPTWSVATRVGAGEQVLAEDTVPFALWCAAKFIESYEEALWNTVSALGDRDTTCAIVGGIVALRSPIPPAWLAARERLG